MLLGEELVLEEFTVSSFEFIVPFLYKGTLDFEKLNDSNYKDVINSVKFYGMHEVSLIIKHKIYVF